MLLLLREAMRYLKSADKSLGEVVIRYGHGNIRIEFGEPRSTTQRPWPSQIALR
jgi:hypothetical protein